MVMHKTNQQTTGKKKLSSSIVRPLRNSWREGIAADTQIPSSIAPENFFIGSTPIKTPPFYLLRVVIFPGANLEVAHRKVNTLYLGFLKKGRKKENAHTVSHLSAKMTYDCLHY